MATKKTLPRRVARQLERAAPAVYFSSAVVLLLECVFKLPNPGDATPGSLGVRYASAEEDGAQADRSLLSGEDGALNQLRGTGVEAPVTPGDLLSFLSPTTPQPGLSTHRPEGGEVEQRGWRGGHTAVVTAIAVAVICAVIVAAMYIYQNVFPKQKSSRAAAATGREGSQAYDTGGEETPVCSATPGKPNANDSADPFRRGRSATLSAPSSSSFIAEMHLGNPLMAPQYLASEEYITPSRSSVNLSPRRLIDAQVENVNPRPSSLAPCP
ncbi:transmembrane protein [Cystoisospora suis]|uniref:Transmembrane protein n=1 Tax=Cystoisospora suis TaxID=483139 RepID=A0A2C6JTI0_9APIC|nr:transmembrane protein [Cystoisospora suis]